MANKICDTFVYYTCICVNEQEICVANVERRGAKMDGGVDDACL